MKGKYSPDEIIRRGNNIYKISVYTGHKQLAEMKKNTKLFRRLCIVIL